MSSVIEYTSIEYIKIFNPLNKFDAIKEIAGVFENTIICTDSTLLINALLEREEIMSTGIGAGIAIPHAKIAVVKEMAFAIGVLKDGVNFDSMDGQPVHLIILVAAGETQHKEYLRLLSNIMSIIKNEKIKESIIQSKSPEEVYEILKSGE